MNLKSVALLSAIALAMPAAALAGPLTFSGTFGSDDAVMLFTFTVPTLNVITMRTTSFANGSTGFEPVLTLFDPAGNLLLQDATGGTVPAGCGLRSIDPTSGYCLDALIQAPLNPGTYTLALSEWDNIPGGPTLADGFPQAGNGNFTGPEFLGSPGSFILFDGSQRTNAWALQIDGLNVPEPATSGFAGAALLAMIVFYRKSYRRGTSIPRQISQ